MMSAGREIKKLVEEVSFGKLKYWQLRLTSYVSMFQFFMIFYLFIVENKWFEWYIWMILVVIVVITIITFDEKFVMEKQLGYAFERNSEWKKHKRNQKKIMEHLGLEYEE